MISNFTGCTLYNASPKDRIVYVSVPLVKVEKPVLPNINYNEIECLSDKTKNTLLERDNVMKKYIKKLETVIESTQKN